ncbi:hypothetical protein K502DRAFT_321331 [Neoconidiobolus thromboides FSU 785]|nr:hypothetical protein K502DRAFT_321331 [Neoconidiobolus thromboides FSU 785]
MVTLNIKQAYNDHPVFRQSVIEVQSSILKDWQEISTWVKAYRGIIESMKVFQQRTNLMTQKFRGLREGIYKDSFDEQLIDKMSKSIELIFNTHISLLNVMDQEVIIPVLNMKSRIQEDLEVKMQKYQQQSNELLQKKSSFIGLKKCYMEPSLAIQLVEESHELYNLKLYKVQSYLNWIDYLNQLKSNSELWWYFKLIGFMERFTRWHSDCLSTLRSTEPTLSNMAENLNSFPEVINLDIPPTHHKIGEELFSTEFKTYKKELGLIHNDNNSMKDVNNEEEQICFGYLIYFLNNSSSKLGFFEINHKSQLILYDHQDNETLKEPIHLFNTIIEDYNHPTKNHILKLSMIDDNNNFELYLQYETIINKQKWMNCFKKYIPEENYKLLIAKQNENENEKTNENNMNNSINYNKYENNNNTIVTHHHNNSSNDMNKINLNLLDSYDDLSSTRSSLIKLNIEEQIIKVGKAYLREYKHNKNKDLTFNHPSTYGNWKNILLHLSSYGYLSLYTENDKNLLLKIDIKEMNRFNINKLDDSYFNEKSTFSIYITDDEAYYFKVETFMERDIWICLLKSFAQPEIFGKLLPLPKLYRVYRSFWLRILDGKNLRTNESIYCQIYFDDKLTGFTSIKSKTYNPFWREDFHMEDLQGFKDGITINLISHHKYSKNVGLAHSFIPVKSIRPGEFYEGWYPLMEGDSNPNNNNKLKDKPSNKKKTLFSSKDNNNNNNNISNNNNNINTYNSNNSNNSNSNNNNNNNQMNNNSNNQLNLPISFNYHGDLRLKLRYDEVYILKSGEYYNLLELILDYKSDLIYDLILNNQHLDWLSETFLKIYSCKNKAIELLNYLAYKEVDNTEDANILFRGNSILTKTIDAYMKMVGLQYLEDTIGGIIREVCNNKIVCEVDSNKLERPEDVKNQWKILFSYCERLWNSIQLSKHLCPRELRLFFFNLRLRIGQKYQNQPELLLMTRYTCVSGFLFLRLFCPAVLSPKLFGLVKDHPDPKTHRTLTLLAKSLQCLANLADFGVKEPYMAQMNGFIMDNMNNLMDFIDYIASEPETEILAVQQEYSAPLHSSGFHGPNPPFVIDLDRELSFLSGFITRYSMEFKTKIQLDKDKVELRRSKSGKLEKLLSICNAIDFMVKDCLKAGQNEIHWKLINH